MGIFHEMEYDPEYLSEEQAAMLAANMRAGFAELAAMDKEPEDELEAG